MAGYRILYKEAGFRAVRDDVDRGVARAAGTVRDRAKRIIRDEGRVDTGALEQSIESTRTDYTMQRVTYEVGSRLPYALAQEEGVQGPIYPKRAKVLRFKPKKGSPLVALAKKKGKGKGYVFLAKVNGFEGIHFMKRAMEGLGPDDFRGGTL